MAKCKICKKEFEKRSPQHVVCCYSPCGVIYMSEITEKKRKKAWNKEKKELKEKFNYKKRSDYLQDLVTIFNKYIRLRDKDEPCISCRRFNCKDWAAGHYYPTNYSFLRFNEDNVNKQCNTHCNCNLRGNLHEYRIHLINKIGLERVLYLDENRHNKIELSIDEIKEKIEFYKQKIKLVSK